MIAHTLIQGTPEWADFRKTKHGASEAAAMLGLSKKVSRNELLHMKQTGSAQEFSDWVQAHILDYGHEVEALARPLFEQMLGEELFPVTVSSGNLSASCDGLTLDGKTAWEHKQWNAELAVYVESGEVPPEHMPQCQQVLMVTKAERLIFGMSDGTSERMVWCEVRPDAAWFGRLRAGWEQFDRDMAEYVHVVDAPKPEADAIRELPALVVHLKGEVVNSNLPRFKAEAEQFIAAIKTDLATDEDFVNADATVKFCQRAEDQLELAKAQAIAQTASIDELMRTVNQIQDQLRGKRLTLSKLIDSKKKELKDGIHAKGLAVWRGHLAALEAEIAPLKLICAAPDLVAATKGKRTLSTLRDAVDTAVANAKIAANEVAADVRAKLSWHKETAGEYAFLFADLQQIIGKPRADFELTVTSRIAEHKERAARPTPAPTPAPTAPPINWDASPQELREAQHEPCLHYSRFDEQIDAGELPADADAAQRFKDAALELYASRGEEGVRALLDEIMDEASKLEAQVAA